MVIFHIIPALWNWYVSNQEVIVDNTRKLCNINQIITDSATDSLLQQIENERAREIIDKIRKGQDVPECDMKELFKLLNDDEKKKLNLKDLTCDFVNCLS